jgi:hypothetical protein
MKYLYDHSSFSAVCDASWRGDANIQYCIGMIRSCDEMALYMAALNEHVIDGRHDEALSLLMRMGRKTTIIIIVSQRRQWDVNSWDAERERTERMT